jgi:hypothetical protein
VDEPQPKRRTKWRRRMKQRAAGADRVREVLASRVDKLPRSLREIEVELNWGHGSLGNLLGGRSKIHLHHIEALAKVLGSTPLELFTEMYGESDTQTGEPQQIPPAYVNGLREMLREVLREELAEALKRQGQ